MWGLFNLETWRNGDVETKANVVIITGRRLAQLGEIGNRSMVSNSQHPSIE
jgi:hypothetical protein